ncbi:MAG: NYN domain-containing protein [Clostridia bacterium]|nr:NYN domain-containing protein [Clostridia bacterium]
MLDDVLIVDGYNFLYSCPELVQLKEESLAHARDRLIAELINYQAFWGGQVIVVFDASRVVGATESREKIGGVEVIFSREGETADNVIEKMVANFETRGQVYVATSDYLEQRLILGKGALRIPVTELRDILVRARREMSKRSRGVYQVNSLDSRLHNETRGILEKWRRQ